MLSFTGCSQFPSIPADDDTGAGDVHGEADTHDPLDTGGDVASDPSEDPQTDAADVARDLGRDTNDTNNPNDTNDANDADDADTDDVDADEPDVPPQPYLTAVWANSGESKVTRDELRASRGDVVVNHAWTGDSVKITGARGEVLAFNLILEAGDGDVEGVGVELPFLIGPGGYRLDNADRTGDGVFDWRGREIELFFVRYLQIRGLSSVAYADYDERHVPERLRRPYRGEGFGEGGWQDRPGADKLFPDIAVPVEWVGAFTVPAESNQSIWADVFVPYDAPAGTYTGELVVRERGAIRRRISVELGVLDFTLPARPALQTMVRLGYEELGLRYVGEEDPLATGPREELEQVRDRHFQMAHRHRIALVDEDPSALPSPGDRPRRQWLSRLDGSLFLPSAGYEGPGAGESTGLYVIGNRGTAPWMREGRASVQAHADNWVLWMEANTTGVDHFLYLADETFNFAQLEERAAWVRGSLGAGNRLPTFATIHATDAAADVPSLSRTASWFDVGIADDWRAAVENINGRPLGSASFYNGNRPATGTFAIEDDGVALRVMAWTQYKHGARRWHVWDSTHYDNFQNGGHTNVYTTAQTFGSSPRQDDVVGERAANYGNGHGVLFYPGTDLVFPTESYGRKGPVASLRLKHWRRGLQDGDYLHLARVVDPGRVDEIVRENLPVSMWEYGVDEPGDPTFVRADISWDTDPAAWHRARRQLAEIITRGQ
jgi:hypothetical protein